MKSDRVNRASWGPHVYRNLLSVDNQQLYLLSTYFSYYCIKFCWQACSHVSNIQWWLKNDPKVWLEPHMLLLGDYQSTKFFSICTSGLNENHQKMPNERCLVKKNICLCFWWGSIVLWLADHINSCSLRISKVFFISCWILDQCALHIASARMLYCTHRVVGKSTDSMGMISKIVGTIWPPWLRGVNWSAKIWGPPIPLLFLRTWVHCCTGWM